MKLNDRLIKKGINDAKQTPKGKKIFDGKGLCLNIRATGGASWQYHYRIGKRPRILSLGTYPTLSLKEARILHQKAVLEKIEGKDPAQIKKESKAALKASSQNTFSRYCWEWLEMRSKCISQEHTLAIKHQLNRLVIPVLGDMPIEQVTPQVVVNLLHELSIKRGLGDTAKRTLQRIKAIMDYAVQLEVVPRNPISSMTNIVHVPSTQHQLALPESELTEFFNRLIMENARPQTKIALLITILTFVRVGSLRRTEWHEIDFKNKLWTIPREKFKGKTMQLEVPLSTWVLNLFQELRTIDRRESGYVFYNYIDGNKCMSENALSYLMGRMGYHGIATPHGFRSLATDILNEKSLFSSDVIERQLGHVERNSSRRPYLRTQFMPARIEMMEWYSNYIRKYYDAAVKKQKRGITPILPR